MRRALLLCSITATTAWNLDLKVRDNTTVALSWNAAPAAARNYSVYRTFGISSRPHEWLLVTKTIAAPGAPGCTAQSSGLLANTTYTFRVCTQQSCSNNASVAMPRGPHGARGAVVMAASARFPRCGEGTVVRWRTQLLLFLSRQAQNADVAASNITLQRSSDGGASWSGPAVVQPGDTTLRGCSRANPGAVTLSNGTIVLSYFVGQDRSSAVRAVRHSHDGGATWQPERLLTDASNAYMTGSHDRLRLLSSGRLIVPVHAKNVMGGSQLGTVVFISDDAGASWQRGGQGPSALPLTTPPGAERWNGSGIAAGETCGESGFWEASLAEVGPGDGALLMVGRTCTGWMWSSRSSDWGNSWSAPEPTALRHPLAPPNVLAVRRETWSRCSVRGSGPSPGAPSLLLLVTSPHFTGTGPFLGSRFVLHLQASKDGGMTWAAHREIEYTAGPEDWFSYSSLELDEMDCVLHLVYRYNNQTDHRVSAVHQRFPFNESVW